MEALVAIKKRLKKWEGEFQIQHDRKPNKEDITTAPEEVRGAYKEYSILRKKSQKTAADLLDNSHLTELNISHNETLNSSTNDVWGSHLNKSHTKHNQGSASWLVNDHDAGKGMDAEKTAEKDSDEEENKPSFTASLKEKLLAKALATSDQQMSQSRSLPFSMKKKKTSVFSANKTSSSQTVLKTFGNQSNNKINSSQNLNVSKDLNQKDNDSDDEIEIKSSIFAKGLKATKRASLKTISCDEDSKFDNFVTVLQQRKSNAFKLQNKYASFSSKTFNSGEFEDLNSSTANEGNETKSKLGSLENEEVDRPFAMFSSNSESSNMTPTKTDTARETTSCVQKYSNHFTEECSSPNKSVFQNKFENNLSKENIAKTSADDEKKLTDKNYSHKESHNKGFNLNIERDFKNADIKPNTDNALKRGRKRKISCTDESVSTPKRRNILNLKSPVTPVNEDSNSVQVEVSWRPNSRQDQELMIDLDNSVQENLSDEEKSDQETQNAPAKKPKKYGSSRSTAPKMSNDNYLRLNMKAKKYQRKGKITSGPAYKRMQWKQKMKARSESYGSGKCFKCGQEGHWANKCKGVAMAKPQKSGIDSVPDTPVEDADFPSMSQAFNMAKGIKKAPTKPRVIKESNPEKVDTMEEVVEDDDEEEEPDIIRAAYEPVPAPPSMEPLFNVAEGDPLPEPTEEVYTGLGKFGFESFRQGQQKAIMRVLSGKSALVVLSTGAGKSLCYQLPAYLYAQREPSITLVISPLVSLMEDQVSRLPPGVKGACLHTNMSPAQREKVADDVTNGRIHFLLISPEAMTGGKAGGCLPGISKLPPIAFACIDEAHCLSEWSHHFRPSYLRICKILRDKFGVKCFLGLTATATMVTAASVAQHLGIHDYHDATIRGSPVPPNLHLSVSRDEDKDEALITLLQGERLSKCDSIIIYCTRREQTDRIATLIRTCMQEMKKDRGPELDEKTQATNKKGKAKKAAKPKKQLDAECYHAGMSAAQRRRVQNAFMCGRLWVVVATVAFGMGLDKPDVRAVIHYNLPKSFESYVQEIGRAGRDGKPAQCHLFLDPMKQDMNELKRHIYSNTVDRYVIKKLVRRLFTRCRCREIHQKHNQAMTEDFDDEVMEGEVPTDEARSEKRLCPGHERAVSIQGMVQTLDMKEEGIGTLLCYLELHPKRWIENFQNVYGTCTIQCYGGPRQLQEIAKKCPPVAVAIAKEKKLGVSHSKSSKLEFPVVEIADSMGWESGPVKRELKLLQWNFDPSGHRGPSKSGVLVELTDLCFHLRSPGDLTDEEVDEIVCFLADRIETQERTELFQLQDFHDTLHKVSHKNVWMCSEHIDEDRSIKLKGNILEYFDRQPDIDQTQITKLSFAREIAADNPALINDKIICENADYVRGDIRHFIQMYSSEHQLNGRSIARVFHGIPSPCFPAEVWGRVRRFWRSHMNTDFNLVRKMATQELVRLK